MYANNQEAFTKSVIFLRGQNSVSLNDKGLCMYRGPDGTKCAIGCLIPDDIYSDEMEGGIIYELMELPSIKTLFQNVDLSLLCKLQGIHDHEYDWEDKWNSLAKEFNLKMPEIDSK